MSFLPIFIKERWFFQKKRQAVIRDTFGSGPVLSRIQKSGGYKSTSPSLRGRHLWGGFTFEVSTRQVEGRTG